MVPCSRSRTNAPPARIIASMVTLLMICITAVNHELARFGLNLMREASCAARGGSVPVGSKKTSDLARRDAPDKARADACRLHRGGIDIHLQRRLAPAQHVLLKLRRHVHDEGELAAVHRRIDAVDGESLGLLEGRRQKRVADALRELRLVFIDKGERSVAELGTRSAGRPIDSKGKCVKRQAAAGRYHAASRAVP